jgi:hypothetical protein
MGSGVETSPEMGEIVSWILDFRETKRLYGRPDKNRRSTRLTSDEPTHRSHDISATMMWNEIPIGFGIVSSEARYATLVVSRGRAPISTCWIKRVGPAMIAHQTEIVTVESLTVPLEGHGDQIEFLLSCTVSHWETGYTPSRLLGFSDSG